MQNIPHGVTEFLSEIILSQSKLNARYEVCKSFRDRLEVPRQHSLECMGCLDCKSLNYLGTVTGNQLFSNAISKCLQRLKFSNDIFFLSFKFSFTEFLVFQFYLNDK